MLKYIKIFLVAAFILNLNACKKFLEFEPENFTLEEDALQSAADLQLLLNSTYDVLRSGSFLGGQVHMLSDLMADDIDGSQLSGDWGAYYDRNTGIFNGSTRSVWQEGYLTIGRCNKLMETFDAIPDLTAEDRARMEAEAKFLRATAHFYLVRLFGQPYGSTADNSQLGIPARTTYTTEQFPRNTVAEVYDLIISDLTDAVAALPETNGGYATSWAAKGMLAKVYFQMNEFQNAYDQADDVINNGPFSLSTDINGRYAQGGSTEGIFELISTGTGDFSGGSLQGYYRTDGGVDPSIRIQSSTYQTALADSSERGPRWYVLKDAGTPKERILLKKFDTIPFFNMPVVHLTELTLIHGEAAAELGDRTIAETDLNAIRLRAGADEILGSDVTTLITLIRDERHVELVGEGHRLHDLKRQAVRNRPNLTVRGASWDCPGMVVQLPDEELRGNPNLVRNDEGGC